MHITLKRGEGVPSSHKISNDVYTYFIRDILEQFACWYNEGTIDLDLLEVPWGSDNNDYFTLEVYYKHGEKIYHEAQTTVLLENITLSGEELGMVLANKVLISVANEHKL
jgi:hypothetical protein